MNGNDNMLNSIDLQHCYQSLTNLMDNFPIENKIQSNDGRELFHYTSSRVLNSILSSGCFRATNIHYLNDKIEYKKGIEILKNIFINDTTVSNYLMDIEKLNAYNWKGLYSISFSTKEDELQQWITYAKESGVCIGLHPDIVWRENAFRLGLKVNDNSYVHFKQTFRKLSYGSTDKSLPQLDIVKIKEALAKVQFDNNDRKDVFDDSAIDEVWEVNPELCKSFLKLLAAYYKEEHFHGEEEIRAAVFPTKKSNKSKSKIQYFDQNNGILRPYLDVFFLHDYNEPQNGGKIEVECPIKTITIGSGGNQEFVYYSIIHRIENEACKIWKYNKEQLGEILSEFVKMGLDICGSKMSFQRNEDIAYVLLEDWLNRSNYDIDIEQVSKGTVIIKCVDKGKGKKSYKTKYVTNDKLQEYLSAYLSDNYLTTSGIWIKRSSSSYIF